MVNTTAGSKTPNMIHDVDWKQVAFIAAGVPGLAGPGSRCVAGSGASKTSARAGPTSLRSRTSLFIEGKKPKRGRKQ